MLKSNKCICLQPRLGVLLCPVSESISTWAAVFNDFPLSFHTALWRTDRYEPLQESWILGGTNSWSYLPKKAYEHRALRVYSKTLLEQAGLCDDSSVPTMGPGGRGAPGATELSADLPAELLELQLLGALGGSSVSQITVGKSDSCVYTSTY